MNLISNELYIEYLINSMGISGIEIKPKAIQDTLEKKQVNPYVAGHFKAFNYFTNQLIGKPKFPAENSKKLTNTYIADNALSWLKELHYALMQPLIQHGLIEYANVGVWRTKPMLEPGKSTQKAPDASIIPKLMMNWIKEVTEFHEGLRTFIQSPGRMSQGEAINLSKRAYETNLFLCSLKPFADGNGRVGRLVENIFRVNWHLPWRIIQHSGDAEANYKDDIARYQRIEFNEILIRCNS